MFQSTFELSGIVSVSGVSHKSVAGGVFCRCQRSTMEDRVETLLTIVFTTVLATVEGRNFNSFL